MKKEGRVPGFNLASGLPKRYVLRILVNSILAAPEKNFRSPAYFRFPSASPEELANPPPPQPQGAKRKQRQKILSELIKTFRVSHAHLIQ